MTFIGLFFCFAFAAAPATKNIPNSFGDQNAPRQIAISVLDADQAKVLFKNFADDKTIPFRYPMKGCEDRATAMALIAEKKQIIVGKVFVQGLLKVRFTHPLYPTASWRRHVAPVIYVKPRFGPAKLMVMDPALFDHPVTIAELETRLLTDIGQEKPEIDETYYGSMYQSHLRKAEEFKNSWDPQYLKDVRATLDEYLDYQDDSSSAPKGREWKEELRVPSSETPPSTPSLRPFNVNRYPIL